MDTGAERSITELVLKDFVSGKDFSCRFILARVYVRVSVLVSVFLSMSVFRIVLVVRVSVCVIETGRG